MSWNTMCKLVRSFFHYIVETHVDDAQEVHRCECDHLHDGV